MMIILIGVFAVGAFVFESIPVELEMPVKLPPISVEISTEASAVMIDENVIIEPTEIEEIPTATETGIEIPSTEQYSEPTKIYVPIYITVPLPVETLLPQPQEPMPSEPTEIASPKSPEIKVINPIPGKGLGRIYYVMPVDPNLSDESNYIVLGFVLKNESGDVVREAVAEVVATDDKQNMTINGTGNLAKIIEDGAEKRLYYYPFTYYFNFSGKHTITFSALGVSTSVEVDVLELVSEEN